MERTKLVPGFRFHPTDIELVKYYLKRKVMRKKICVDVIADVEIYKYSPWDLPDKSLLQIGDLKWYFFCPVEKKYGSGARMNRATESGYWKATGKDRPVVQNTRSVGIKKTLVFHIGRAPIGVRTDWVMHEYRLVDYDLTDQQLVQDPYVLCVVYKKDGPGPQNGAQYGAPFNDEDWDDDENIWSEAIPHTASGEPVSSMFPVAYNGSKMTGAFVTETAEVGVPCLSTISGVEPDPCNMLPLTGSHPDAPVQNDDIVSMLTCFTDDTMALDGRDNAMKSDILVDNGVDGIQPYIDQNDIYNGLDDLEDMGGLGENVCDFSSVYRAAYAVEQVLTGQEMPFLELHDLNYPLPWSSI